MNPVAMGRAISRGWWRYQHKYIFPKYCGLTPVVHYIVGISTLFYCLNYKKYSECATTHETLFYGCGRLI
jgi:F-type H+-transporting ATPase subunit f